MSFLTKRDRLVLAQKIPPVLADTKNIFLYRTEFQLGGGSFSLCYKVVEYDTGVEYACKISRILEHIHYEKIIREITLHRRLQHRHIVWLYNHFMEDNNLSCMILELCHESLSDILKRGKISQMRALGYTEQISSACEFMHEDHRIIHRDLKPENILLKDNQVKISDFGLSKELPVNSRIIPIGKVSTGTSKYMPPEVLGLQYYSPESDSWAVGIIYHKMRTGSHPFTPREIGFHIPRGYKPPPSFDEIDATISKNLLKRKASERWDMINLVDFVRNVSAPTPKDELSRNRTKKLCVVM